MLVFLVFKFLLWVGSFLTMFGDLRMVASQSLLSGWIGRLEFCVLLVLFQKGGVLPR